MGSHVHVHAQALFHVYMHYKYTCECMNLFLFFTCIYMNKVMPSLNSWVHRHKHKKTQIWICWFARECMPIYAGFISYASLHPYNTYRRLIYFVCEYCAASKQDFMMKTYEVSIFKKITILVLTKDEQLTIIKSNLLLLRHYVVGLARKILRMRCKQAKKKYIK